MARILIIGGYGAFGSRIAERLSLAEGLEIVIAGRSRERAERKAALLRSGARSKVTASQADGSRLTEADLMALGTRIVINASGPYQGQDYALARAAMEAGSHYIDLADARGFVAGIAALDAAARERGVLVVSGASSVPGLSSAAVAAFASEFAELSAIDIGISPGNSFDPGLATTASVLAGVGKPMTMLIDGAWQTVFGWQGHGVHAFPKIGNRLLGYVDVPDLDLFPRHYPSLQTSRFRAGLEVALFHCALWGLSWLVRAGVVRHAERLAGPLLSAKRRLGWLGTDRGGMFVTLEGRAGDGSHRRLTWNLIAANGHGPYIPAMAAIIIAQRLARGEESRRGAMACFELVTLEEFYRAAAGLDISWTVSRGR